MVSAGPHVAIPVGASPNQSMTWQADDTIDAGIRLVLKVWVERKARRLHSVRIVFEDGILNLGVDGMPRGFVKNAAGDPDAALEREVDLELLKPWGVCQLLFGRQIGQPLGGCRGNCNGGIS